MSARDLAQLEAVAGDELEQFGYERALVDVPAAARAAARVAKARSAVRRAVNRRRNWS
jgi:hypothetical protein